MAGVLTKAFFQRKFSLHLSIGGHQSQGMEVIMSLGRVTKWCRAGVLALSVLAAPAQAQVQSVLPSSDYDSLATQVRAPRANARIVEDAKVSAFELFRQGRFAAALELFQAILTGRPREPRALYGASLCLFNLQRTAEAETVAQMAIATAKKVAARKKNTATRAVVLDQVADALVLLGVVRAVQRDNEGALRAVTEAVTLAPRHFDAQFALGRARFGAGDPTGAATAFRAAIALQPNDARARFFLATALENATDYAGATAAYRDLVNLAPNLADGHLGLGVLLVKAGGAQLAEGIIALQRAVALKGNLYEGRVTLGRALIQAGRAAEAVEHLQNAAALSPANPEPHFQLAQAYRRLGRKADADAETEIVRQLHEVRRKAGNQAPAIPQN